MIHDTTAHTLLHKALEVIRMASSGHPFATRAALARATGESEANISRWLSGASTPTLKKLEPLLLRLGVRLILPAEETPPPLVIHMPPHAESSDVVLAFRAVLLLGETGLPPCQQHASPEWLVARCSDASENAVALRVGVHDRAMLPSLHPGDIVFIDRTSSAQLTSQNIYLVQAPPCEESNVCGLLLRRVSVKKQAKDTQIIFYADNACEGYAPEMYSLSQYPEKSLSAAIKGTVTHVLADMRQRSFAQDERNTPTCKVTEQGK